MTPQFPDALANEFLAMLGHELRNPLAPIRTAAEVISTLTLTDPRGQAAAQIIERQVAHMARLIDDLLDAARVSRGIESIGHVSVELAGVVRDALEQAQATITARGHVVEISVDAADLHVAGDRKRLVQVIVNLLANAARYTPPRGRIRVALAGTATEATILVEDNGVGMDAELLPRVFDLFAQGQRTSDRPLGGLGLGLALVKNLVQLHGGRVEASSDGIGQGSCFAIHLPRLLVFDSRSAPDAANECAIGSTVPALSIMVVDDNADAANMLSMILEMQGHLVHTEIDPRDALARAVDVHPDVFVLDIGMPYIDGYEVAQNLRADKRLGHPTLIALTGYGQPGDIARAEAAGFDHHLVKPVDARRLQSLLKAVHRADIHA